MLIAKLKSFFRVYHQNQLLPISPSKHYKGIFFTALAWLLIWFSSIELTPIEMTISRSNFFFYEFLIAFMALGLLAGIKGKVCLFSKNPGGITINSLAVIACFILFFIIPCTESGSALYTKKPLFLGLDGLLVALIATLILRQKVPKTLWIGISLLLLGALWIQIEQFSQILKTPSAELIVFLLHTIFLSVIVISSNYLIRNGNPPVVICLYNTLLGFLFFGFLSIHSGMSIPSMHEFLILVIDGVLYALAIILFTSAHYFTEFYFLMPVQALNNFYNLFVPALIYRKIPPSGVLWGSAVLLIGLILSTYKKAKKPEYVSMKLPKSVDTAA